MLRIRDVYPGSRILIFTHPGSRIPKPQQKRGVKKKFVVIPFYLATNFTKLNIILVLKCLIKKFGSIFKELYNVLPKKLSLSSQTYGFGIRDPEKTYSGSRIQGSKRHRIPDPDPQHCKTVGLTILLFLLDYRRIWSRSRIRTSYYWIWIRNQEAQIHRYGSTGTTLFTTLRYGTVGRNLFSLVL